MNIRKIDDSFAVTGQITPEGVKAVAESGYNAILCTRPDDEEYGQPSFADVARAAEAEGLTILHIPVSGGLREGDMIRLQQAWPDLPKPVLGYCRSGARAAALYQTLAK